MGDVVGKFIWASEMSQPERSGLGRPKAEAARASKRNALANISVLF